MLIINSLLCDDQGSAFYLMGLVYFSVNKKKN